MFGENKILPIYSNDKNAVNICFAVNETYAKPLSVTIYSLLKNADQSRWIDIVILTGEMSEQSKELLCKQALGYPKVSIRIVPMESYTKLIQTETKGYLTIETYFRLFLLSELFSEYGKMLYLDSDTLILDDLGALFDTDISGHKAGAVEAYMIRSFLFRKNPVCLDKQFYSADTYCKKIVGLNSIHEYFNAGVLLLNLTELRKTVTMEQILQMIQTRHFKHNDQDILNILVAGDFVPLPVRYNYQNCYENIKRSGNEELKAVMQEAFCENPAVIHYVSAMKPWNDEKVVLKEIYDTYVDQMK